MRFANTDQSYLNLLQQLFSNNDIQAKDAFSQYMIPRDTYNLDPISAAQKLQSTQKYLKNISKVAEYERFKREQPIDSGSLAVDNIFAKLGFSTNMAGIRNPASYYALAPDAYMKRQYVPIKKQGVTGKGTMVEFINLTDTPMMDWDTPGPDHKDANVTMRHLGDVEDVTRAYVEKYPTSKLQVYRSPGGFRAWEMSDKLNTKAFFPRAQELQVDPDYARISLDGNVNKYRDTDIMVDPPGFRSRISHKPGRTDWVAQPLFTVKGKEAMTSPRSKQLIQLLHDEPIRRAYLNNNGISPDAVSLIKAELSTASNALQKELRRRFRI